MIPARFPHPVRPVTAGPAAGSTRRRRRPAGFTLIELLIALAVVAILGLVAYPAFQEQVRKSRRAEAWSLLQNAALAQEKHRGSNPSFSTAVTDLAGACPASGTCASTSGYYSLGITAGTATAYTLNATAVSGSSQASDSGCTVITLAQSAASGTLYTPAGCWKK